MQHWQLGDFADDHPVVNKSPAVKSGLSLPRFQAYCSALMITGSSIRSRNTRRRAEHHVPFLVVLMRMGRIFGVAVRAMRLASVT